MCIDYARENCNTHAFPTGNAADSRSAIFELLVKQVMKDDQDEWPMTVRLLVVDVPPTDKLTEEEEMLRAQQGTTLHRSLLSFRSVCKALSRKHDMWNAPFGQSKLTAVLQVCAIREALSHTVPTSTPSAHPTHCATLTPHHHRRIYWARTLLW